MAAATGGGTQGRVDLAGREVLAGRDNRHDVLAAGECTAAGLLHGHGKGRGLANHQLRANRNHDLSRIRRYIEYAAIDRVALVASRVEYPYLIRVHRRVVGSQAGKVQESALCDRIPYDITGNAGGRRILGRRQWNFE